VKKVVLKSYHGKVAIAAASLGVFESNLGTNSEVSSPEAIAQRPGYCCKFFGIVIGTFFKNLY
jgi:hypothetical protein